MANCNETDILSPYFPYKKPLQSAQTLAGSDDLSRRILYYFMDLPNPIMGYVPIDDNEKYPRCRLWKYLYYDDDFPLAHKLPTGEQKRQLLYEGIETPPNREKGFRLYAQPLSKEAQNDAQTVMRIFTGDKIPHGMFETQIAVYIQLMTSMSYEYMAAQAKVRTEAMEQAVMEAFNGIDIDGLGVAYDRSQHFRCGTRLIGDGINNVGREVVFTINYVSGIGSGTT